MTTQTIYSSTLPLFCSGGLRDGRVNSGGNCTTMFSIFQSWCCGWSPEAASVTQPNSNSKLLQEHEYSQIMMKYKPMMLDNEDEIDEEMREFRDGQQIRVDRSCFTIPEEQEIEEFEMIISTYSSTTPGSSPNGRSDEDDEEEDEDEDDDIMLLRQSMFNRPSCVPK
eukprot:TRINITY_DN25205_c0_g1_i1.p3 TRINITY_DN25205_c0_g1~~TRINITY_DN25205_c0_g1_i1.p3  ORF type:complete len:167 (-),score=29.04 TRINITY_DN25205_c0_g1_i1:680-1180(-)